MTATSVAAEEVCCDILDLSIYLTGEAENGGMTPFHSSLASTPHEVALTQSSGSSTEVASWRTNWLATGSIPVSTWTLEVPYEVENAAGMQMSASVEIRIGTETYIGEQQAAPYQQSGRVSIDVEIPATEIRAGDTIEAAFSVNAVLFESPVGDESGIRFIWGSQSEDGALEATLPFLDVEVTTPSVSDGIVYFPILLIAGHAEELWAHSNHSATLQGKELTETPLATKATGGVEVTFLWAHPEDAQSGTYRFELRLTPQPGLQIVINATHAIDLSGEGSSGSAWYPENEPLRSGGSALTVSIDVHQTGDELHRTTTIGFEGAMAIWLRWGLDNIGNESLDSTSWWRSLSRQASTVPEEDRHNRRVDESEILALERHLTGSTSDLSDFLANGLALEAKGLLGADAIDLGPTSVVFDLGGETSFGSGRVALTIESMRYATADEPMLLVRDFLRNQRDDYWATVVIDATLSTGLASGLSSLSAQGVEVNHLRLVLTERVSVHLEGNAALTDFVIEFVPASTPLESPIFGAILTILAILAGILLTGRVTKHRKRSLIAAWNVLVAGLAIAGYAFGLHMLYLLGGIGAVQTVIGVPIGILSPSRDDHSMSSRVESALPSQPTASIADCPICGEENEIESEQRPIKVPCGGCGRTLRIEA